MYHWGFILICFIICSTELLDSLQLPSCNIFCMADYFVWIYFRVFQIKASNRSFLYNFHKRKIVCEVFSAYLKLFDRTLLSCITTDSCSIILVQLPEFRFTTTCLIFYLLHIGSYLNCTQIPQHKYKKCAANIQFLQTSQKTRE